jgi:glycosyltransferase involved in cell wall biosynthesis
MRIVYVCADPGVPLLGGKGASVHVRAITSALARRGHQVVVAFAASGSGNPPPVVDRLVDLDDNPEHQQEILAELLAEHAADAVIERYSLACGPARRASAIVGVPLVLEVNAPLVLEAARHRGLVDLDRWLAYERDVFASADAIGVVSRALATYVTSTVAGLTPGWVSNGVDFAPFEQAVPDDLGLPRGAIAVGFAGSMKAWHGVADLIDAMQLLVTTSPAHLVLIGSGPQADLVRRQVADHGLSGRTRILGQVSHHQIPSLLAALDVSVAPYTPSTDFYFSPLKVLEYLAAGLPVVCPRLGDLAELVGEAGVLYRPGDVGDLAAKIASLVEDPRRRRAAAGAAQARAACWTWDANAAGYEELIAGAISGAPAVLSAPS